MTHQRDQIQDSAGIATRYVEADLEYAALEWLEGLGYATVNGKEIAPGELGAERASFADVVLEERLRSAIARLNPDLPHDAQEETVRKLLRLDSPSLVLNNRQFHQRMRDGVGVEYRSAEGRIVGGQARLIDFEDPDSNDWLAVSQFTVIENQHDRRPDVVVFVNGLPLAVFELKNIGDEDATVDKAYAQLQTYKRDIPSLFTYNELLVISDGQEARIGSLTAGFEWFKAWPTVDDDKPIKSLLPLDVLIKGVFEKSRFLELIRDFILFEDDPDTGDLYKILAGYHQFWGAKSALESTLAATEKGGDQRGGVVWHTQGSGKSFTMLFLAGMLVSHPRMNNPTLVVLTDRNDLDDQLFGQFQRCSQILRQVPVQADSIDHLRDVLQVASGGVVFATVHKFAEAEGAFPQLSDRRNVVVMADEAHRSQYGFTARRTKDKLTGEEKIAYGFARNIRDALPNATFVGFTGTPIELNDKNTRAVFGNYVSVYDIQRAVEDKATVPIYYESRVIKLTLEHSAISEIDEEFEEVTESSEETVRERLKTKWSALEAMVGDDDRIQMLAEDLVNHFEQRVTAMDGKGMIVCMSRRICVDLYDALVALRPDWHSEDDNVGFLKIVMTGSAADGPEWQQHVRTKERRKALASRFKDAGSSFQLVIVRDMWLTGFDVPSMHTMYIDKPMQGHGLMQAIARVNRVFKDKPGGLIVDYLGIGDSLKKALKTYTESGGKGDTTHSQAEAIAALLHQYELCCDMLHSFDWSSWVTGTPGERATITHQAQQYILEQENGRERWVAHVTNLTRAFALCPTHEQAMAIRDDVAFFQIIRAMFRAYSGSGKSKAEMDYAIRQLVAKAVITADEAVIDVYAAAGVDKPDVSILSDDFLDEVRHLPHKNVASELLKKLLKDEIKIRQRRNVVQSRQFSELLQKALNSYHNRAITTQEVIEELIELAKQLRAADERGEALGLSLDEVCFYDALANHETAVDVMSQDDLKVIATELVMRVRENVTIDWQHRESARAKIRVVVKRILRNRGYPPDLQEAAVKLVLEQAELLSHEWVTNS